MICVETGFLKIKNNLRQPLNSKERESYASGEYPYYGAWRTR